MPPLPPVARIALRRTPALALLLVMATVGADAFSRVAGVSLTPTFGRFSQGAVDTGGDYLYFAAPLRPGALARIRLSDFTRAGELFLNPDEIDAGLLVVDPVGRFAYTDSEVSPGRLVKVSLDTFQRAGSLSLSAGRWPGTAVIDPARGFLWVSVTSTHQRLVKIRLSNFTETGQILEIPAGQSFETLAYDTSTGVGYFVENGPSPRLVKADFLSMTRLEELPLVSGEVHTKVAVLDRARGFLYLAGDSNRNVLRVRLSPLERAGELTLPQGAAAGGVLDPNGQYAYFAVTTAAQGHIQRIDLNAFALAGVLSTAAREQARSLTIDPRTRQLYFTSKDLPAAVTRVDLATFSRGPTLAYDWGESYPGALFKDTNGYVYFGTDTLPRKAVRVRMSDLAVSTTALPGAPGVDIGLKTGFADPNGQYVYFVTHGVPTRITRVRTSDFAVDQSLDLPNSLYDPGLVWESVVDPGTRRAFLSTSGASPPRVGIINLAGFFHERTIELPAEYNALRAGDVDPVNGFVYFVAGPAVVKINAQTLDHVLGSVRGAGEVNSTAFAVDPAGFAYFAGVKTVVKVRLSDFVEVERIVHPGLGNMTIESMAIDPADNAGYAGTYGSPAAVVKFRLSPLAWTDAAGMRHPESWLSSVVVDTATQKAFFADYGLRSGVAKLNLATPLATPGVPTGSTVTLVTAKTVRARVNDVPEAELYRFFASTVPGPSPSPGAVVNDSETTIGLLTALLPGTTYYLHVQACNSVGCSAHAAFGPARTKSGAPAGGQIVAALPNILSAQWSPVAGATLYTLGVSQGGGAPTPGAPTAFAALGSGSLSGLEVNQRYTLFVNACEEGVCSDWTVLGASSTLANAPGGLALVGAGPGSVTLSVDANGNPAGTTYVIEKAPAPAGPFVPALTTVSLNPTITGLADRASYAFRARAVNRDGVPTAYTGVLSAVTEAGAPRAFPNPVGPGQTLTLTGFRPDGSLTIFRVTGARVRELIADNLGQALWDAADESGAPAGGGLFLVLGDAPDGSRRLVKVAVER